MRLVPWKTLSLVIDGDDLVCAGVVSTPFGVRASRGPRIAGFLRAPADEARRAMAGASTGQGRVVVTVPASWCSVRPIALRCEQWQAARPEIMRSLSSLLPLAPTDALVGVIDRSAGEGDSSNAGAYLVAIDRARLDPWLAAIRSALGTEVYAVLAPHMAMLGLGLQSAERAEVLEQRAGGGQVCHRLWRGDVTEMFAPLSDSESPRSVLRVRLPGSDDRGGLAGAAASGQHTAAKSAVGVDAWDLAIAAALAPHVAPGSYVPLLGRRSTGAWRWALPAAAIALALLATWGASQTNEARFLAAAERVEREQAAWQAQLAEVERDRDETLRLVGLLEAAARGPVAVRRSVLPELAAAHAALPAEGFLYRVELDGAGVALRGESKRASDVLQALDATPGFKGARNVSTPAPVEERSSEMFDIRAERVPGAATGATR